MHYYSTLRSSLLFALGLCACGREALDVEEASESSGDPPEATTTVPPPMGSSTSPSPATTGPDPSTGTPPPSCAAVLQEGFGTPSGFESCDGVLLRREAVACQLPERSETPSGDCSEGCSSDLDCDEAPHGYCEGLDWGCGCSYGCTSDDDCEAGSICMCDLDIERSPRRAQCIPAGCTSDDDCEPGQHCALAVSDDGCGNNYRMACQTAEDTCTSEADCPEGSGGCAPYDSTAWQCVEQSCVIGRPFLVGGRLVSAPTAARDDWNAPVEPGPRSLSRSEREALTQHWLEAATMEHASVGSFARFVLQLLSLGAPPELLRAAGDAMNDEIDHARRCYALASRYGRRPLGPGPLPISRETLAEASFLEILDAVIVEACIGETLATLEASVALAQARDPEVRATLEVIARDEARHAELGWQTLRWALRSTDDATRRIVAERLLDAIARAERRLAEPRPSSEHDDEALAAHGMLSAARRRRVLEDGLREVVRPVALALSSDPRGAELPFAS